MPAFAPTILIFTWVLLCGEHVFGLVTRSPAGDHDRRAALRRPAADHRPDLCPPRPRGARRPALAGPAAGSRVALVALVGARGARLLAARTTPSRCSPARGPLTAGQEIEPDSTWRTVGSVRRGERRRPLPAGRRRRRPARCPLRPVGRGELLPRAALGTRRAPGWSSCRCRSTPGASRPRSSGSVVDVWVDAAVDRGRSRRGPRGLVFDDVPVLSASRGPGAALGPEGTGRSSSGADERRRGRAGRGRRRLLGEDAVLLVTAARVSAHRRAARSACSLAAGGGPAEEPAALEARSSAPGMVLLKRCVDLADLLATAATGSARSRSFRPAARARRRQRRRLDRRGVRTVVVTATRR